MKRHLLFLLSLILFSVPAFAADVAVSSSGTGTKSGADWSNTADWSTMSFTRGNTYYLADNTYAGKTLSTAASGATLITIKKATVASHGPAGGWVDSMGDGQAVFDNATISFRTSSWIFDGVSRQSDNTGYGFKIVGPSGNNTYAVSMPYSYTTDNVSVKYVEITSQNIPVTACCSDNGLCTDKLVYIANVSDNVTFDYVYIHDGVVPMLVNNTNHFTFSNSRLERNIAVADGTCPVNHHTEGMSLNGGTNMLIKNNYINDINGNGTFSFMNGGDPDNVVFYNNIINGGSLGASGGVVSCINTGTTCTNFVFNHNTIVNVTAYARLSVASGATGSGWSASNNLWFCDVGTCGVATHVLSSPTLDHNWYGGVSYTAAIETNEINGGSENPFTNSAAYDFTLKAGSTPVDNGATLGAPYNVDFLGNTRPSGAAYDIGAYEYGGVDTTPSAFSFANQTGVALGSTGNTDNTTLTGFDNTTTLVLTGDASCKYSINGAAWATANDNVNVNDNVALQNVASDSYSTAVGCTLTVGGVANTGAPWTRTTLAAADAVTTNKNKMSGPLSFH